MVDSTSGAWQRWWSTRPVTTPVEVAARRQGFVLTLRDCGTLGVSISAGRTAVRRGRWFRAAAGVVSPFDLALDSGSEHEIARRRHATSTAATVLRRPDHVASARSAAVLHGLPVRRLPALAEVTAPNVDGLGAQHPSHAFGARLFASSVTAWHGVLVTTVPRTVVDVARHDRWDGVMAADAAIREGLVTAEDLDLELTDARGWPGVRGAREVVALADPLAESPLESAVRLALFDSGFPPPVLQQWIGTDRVDFWWPRFGLVLEADGRGKYTDDALWREKEREQRLRRHGVRVIERVVWGDVFGEWSSTQDRLQRYFRPATIRPAPSSPVSRSNVDVLNQPGDWGSG